MNVLEHPALDPKEALAHFRTRLQYEVDAADLYEDLQHGGGGFVVIDTRKPETYARGHIPGAINIPHRTMDAQTTAHLSKNDLMIVYCDGPGCNAAPKGAVRMAQLGFRVKELAGGIEWWSRVDGFPVATGAEVGELRATMACGC